MRPSRPAWSATRWRGRSSRWVRGWRGLGSATGCWPAAVRRPRRARRDRRGQLRVKLPEDWSYEEGAAAPVVYATAYAGLIRYGSVHEGERISCTPRRAVWASPPPRSASTWARRSSAPPPPEARGGARLGVDHPIDYRTQDFVKEVRRISGEKRLLDLVMDAIGGKSFRKSFSLLPRGRPARLLWHLLGAGAASAAAGLRRSRPSPRCRSSPGQADERVQGRDRAEHEDALGREGIPGRVVGPLRAWIEEGRIRPVVAEAFPLERAAEAHRFMHERKNVGKSCWPASP